MGIRRLLHWQSCGLKYVRPLFLQQTFVSMNILHVTCLLTLSAQCTVHSKQTLYHVFTPVHSNNPVAYITIFLHSFLNPWCFSFVWHCHLYCTSHSIFLGDVSWFYGLYAITSPTFRPSPYLYLTTYNWHVLLSIFVLLYIAIRNKQTPVPFPLSSSISTFSRFLVQQEFQSGYKYEY